MAINRRNHLQTRIQSVLSSIDRSAAEPYFYTQRLEKEKSASLVALFDNGIDPDPAYSGSVMGRIFIDSEHNLCLAVWPQENRKNLPWRKEILLPGVKSFEFEFLGKRTASEHGKNEKIKPINATLAWRTEWAKFQTAIPSVVRLRVVEEKGKEPLQFAFILPSSEPFVTYLEKKAG